MGLTSIQRTVSMIVIAVLALAGSAQLVVSSGIVPGTLQTSVLIVAAGLLGSRNALIATALYVVGGALGIPWFSGLDADMSITGGYIIGFVPAAGLIGWYADKGACAWYSSCVGVFVQGLVVVYLCGVLWMMQASTASLPDLIAVGVHPTVVQDVCEILLASAIISRLRAKMAASKEAL